MTEAILQAFGAELEKVAVSDAERVRNRAYYQKNRSRRLAKGREYRRKNSFKIKKQRAIYARKVKSGQIRQRKRVHSGSSYSYAGVR